MLGGFPAAVLAVSIRVVAVVFLGTAAPLLHGADADLGVEMPAAVRVFTADEIGGIDFAHMTTAIRSMLEPIRWLANSEFVPQWLPGKKP